MMRGGGRNHTPGPSVFHFNFISIPDLKAYLKIAASRSSHFISLVTTGLSKLSPCQRPSRFMTKRSGRSKYFQHLRSCCASALFRPGATLLVCASKPAGSNRILLVFRRPS